MDADGNDVVRCQNVPKETSLKTSCKLKTL